MATMIVTKTRINCTKTSTHGRPPTTYAPPRTILPPKTPQMNLWNGVLMRLVGFSCLGGFLFGYDTGVTSGCLVFLKDYYGLNYFEEEEIVSSTVLAAAVGCLLVGVPMSNYGRRPMLFVTTMLYTTGALIVAAATDFEMVVCGRVVLGFGVGMASILSPVYIAEAAPSSWRAGLVALNTLMIVLGQVFSCLVNAAVDDMSYSYNWRISMGFAGVPSMFMFFGLFSLPESPRWLLSKGREEDARASLAKIRGPENDATEELKIMAAGIAAEQSDMSFIDMWK
jgi:MFS family permease